MILLVDDLRNMPEADVTARNYKAAIAVIDKVLFDELWLDGDLGEEDNNSGVNILEYVLFRPGIMTYQLPRKVFLVTENPVKLQEMGLILERAGYNKKDPRTFYLELP